MKTTAEVKKLVEAALARRPKVVVLQRLEIAPALLTRWANGTSTPREDQIAKLEAIVSEPEPGAESATEGAMPPPADDEIEVTEASAAPGEDDGDEEDEPAQGGKTIGPDADAPVKTPAPEPAGAPPEHVAAPIDQARVNALAADRRRHEEDARDVAALVGSPGWNRIVLPALLAKREGHRNALLDAKGRDVPWNQGAYAALDWLSDLVRKPAAELATARAEMPLFNDAGEPAGASA